MRLQNAGQVCAPQHIPIEHHGGIAPQPVVHVTDTAPGTQRLVLNHVLDIQAQRLPRTEIFFKYLCLKRCAQYHMFNPGCFDTGQQMHQKRHASRR